MGTEKIRDSVKADHKKENAMNDYSSYFLMDDRTVVDYVRTKTNFFPDEDVLEGKEIGDGNVNYVFRVASRKTGRSIIVKQAGQATRIDHNWFLSTDRGRIETEILKIQNELAPGLVPEVYLYDEVMFAIVMEDMVHHEMMRDALMQHKSFPLFADQISTFLAQTLLRTNDLVMEHKAKKERVKSFINPELCEITEQLVYSEPYNNCRGRNHVFPANADFVEQNLYQNKPLHLAVAKLRFEFMNNAQSLVHGDLHTGSIFINQEHAYVFDPEFAFYGPAGYDIGNILANLFFAWGNGLVTMEDGSEKENYLRWLESCVRDIVDLFIEKYHQVFRTYATDEMASAEGFEDWYLSQILLSAAGCAGLEMNRRIVDMANVKDITGIEDPDRRVRAERIIITTANELILHADRFVSGQEYVRSWNSAAAKF